MRGALATGAQGAVVEIHHRPAATRVDGSSALTLEQWGELMAEVNRR